MTEKNLNSSVQRQRILMCKLNSMVMMPIQDADENLTEVFQQRDELEHIGDSFTETHTFDFILEGLSDECEPSEPPPSGNPKSC